MCPIHNKRKKQKQAGPNLTPGTLTALTAKLQDKCNSPHFTQREEKPLSNTHSSSHSPFSFHDALRRLLPLVNHPCCVYL